MSSRRQRERMRLARIEYDRANEEGRKENEILSMTKAQLIQYAEYNGIEINKSAKKAEIADDVLEIVKGR